MTSCTFKKECIIFNFYCWKGIKLWLSKIMINEVLSKCSFSSINENNNFNEYALLEMKYRIVIVIPWIKLSGISVRNKKYICCLMILDGEIKQLSLF